MGYTYELAVTNDGTVVAVITNENGWKHAFIPPENPEMLHEALDLAYEMYARPYGESAWDNSKINPCSTEAYPILGWLSDNIMQRLGHPVCQCCSGWRVATAFIIGGVLSWACFA